MATIVDLGKLVKAKYPQYNDLSDYEVGKRVKAKYPTQYADFVDAPDPGKPSAGEKFVNTVKAVGNALTSSEQTLGRGLSTVFNKEAQKTANQVNQQSAADQQSIIKAIRAQTDPAKKQHLIDFLKRNWGVDYKAVEQGDINPAFNMTKKQVLGAALGTALDVVSAGSYGKAAQGAETGVRLTKAANVAARGAEAADVAKTLTTGQKLGKVALNTAKSAIEGAATGYGYDVAGRLQADNNPKNDIFTGSGLKNISADLKPGWGTALGATLPVLFGAYKAGKISTNALGARIDNSLIKPLPKQFRYGKNPGRTMAELKITGNSEEDLIRKLSTTKQNIGKDLQQTAQQLDQALQRRTPSTQRITGKATQTQPIIELSQTLSPLDAAMKRAAANNDATLLQRLFDAKQALTSDLVPVVSEGKVGIVSKGTKQRGGTFLEALQLKRDVGDITKWTANPSEDKTVNKTLREIYGNISDQLRARAREADPRLAAKFEKLNQQYGDVLTAEIATRHTAELSQRHNLVSMPVKVGGIAGVVTAIATGGLSVPAFLAAAGVGLLDKALSTVAVKTRIASFLASQSPQDLERLFASNPSIRRTLLNVMTKLGIRQAGLNK